MGKKFHSYCFFTNRPRRAMEDGNSEVSDTPLAAQPSRIDMLPRPPELGCQMQLLEDRCFRQLQQHKTSQWGVYNGDFGYYFSPFSEYITAREAIRTAS